MYYQLIASLPRLPYFARAEFLPITRQRLQQRLRQLQPADAQQLTAVLELVRWWPRRAVGGSDQTLLSAFRAAETLRLHPALREYLVHRMQLRTLLAALRRKRAGQEPPGEREAWGVEPLASRVRRRWSDPHFGLAGRFRWLPAADELLAAADARGLERLLMDVTWRELTRLGERQMFDFPAVFAYAGKWDILQAWLAGNAAAGKIKFQALIEQVTHVDSPT